jgi:hypothetical protein
MGGFHEPFLLQTWTASPLHLSLPQVQVTPQSISQDQ